MLGVVDVGAALAHRGHQRRRRSRRCRSLTISALIWPTSAVDLLDPFAMRESFPPLGLRSPSTTPCSSVRERRYSERPG